MWNVLAIDPNIKDRWFCDSHFRYLIQQSYASSYNYLAHSKCYDCNNLFTSDRASIQDCVHCNNKCQVLKKQGISGPFGSAKK